MTIKFSDIEDAFISVSMGVMFTCITFLCKKTGTIFYISDAGDLDAPSEYLDDDLDNYIDIPHKNDLNFAKLIVLEFSVMYLQDKIEKVNSFYRRKGAYSQLSYLLAAKEELLDKCYAFKEGERNKALNEWRKDNDIIVEG